MILLGCLIASMIASTLYIWLGPIAMGSFAWWQIPVAFVVFYLAAFLLFCLFLSVAVLFHSKKDETHRVKKLYMVTCVHIVRFLQQLFRLRLVTENVDLIPDTGPFLFVCNHQSNFDPLVALWMLRKHRLPMVMKDNMLKVPVVGRWMLASGFIPIDRKNNRKTIEAISFAAKKVKQGEPFGIFPEGTRSRTHNMLPFRHGAFRIAQKGEAPILVCIVDGMYKVKHRFPLRSTKVFFKVCEIIPYEEIKELSTPEIGDRVHKIMEDNIQEAREKYDFLKVKESK